MNALGLGTSRASESMVLRPSLPLSERALDENIDDDSVLGVHADQAALFSGRRHGLENCSVVDQKNARIGYEQLESRYTLIDEVTEFGDSLIRKIRDDHVKAVVDRRLAFRFSKPDVQSLIQSLAMILHSEVDDCRGSAKSCGSRSGF